VTDLRQVFDDLVRFETILWGAIDGRLQEECGVGLASLNAMLVIDATPLCRVHDIARAVAITVGGASQAVDRLESAGLCARRANPSDRRSSIVELTPRARNSWPASRAAKRSQDDVRVRSRTSSRFPALSPRVRVECAQPPGLGLLQVVGPDKEARDQVEFLGAVAGEQLVALGE
jgi:DNA-binding MarR family transcriptional regulator